MGVYASSWWRVGWWGRVDTLRDHATSSFIFELKLKREREKEKTKS